MAFIKVVLEACLLIILEVLQTFVMLRRRVVGIVSSSDPDDDACKVVAFASVASKPFPSVLFPGLEFVDYAVENS